MLWLTAGHAPWQGLLLLLPGMLTEEREDDLSHKPLQQTLCTAGVLREAGALCLAHDAHQALICTPDG